MSTIICQNTEYEELHCFTLAPTSELLSAFELSRTPPPKNGRRHRRRFYDRAILSFLFPDISSNTLGAYREHY